jgi:ankyrin repeat protein
VNKELGTFGKTALMCAVSRNQTGIVDFLLRHNLLHVNAQDPDKSTALHHAAYLGHVEIVELLLRANADIKIQNDVIFIFTADFLYFIP